MKKKKMIKFRLIILMVLCAGLLLGAWIVRGHLIHEPFRTNVRQAFQAPCREYIFGTDNLGRCVACRILYGAATSLYAAVIAVIAVFIIGTAVGVTAAYAGGIVDRILMKITLVFQAFPNFILAVAVAGMLGTGLKNSVLALGAVYWITYAKLSRSLVLSIRVYKGSKNMRCRTDGNYFKIYTAEYGFTAYCDGCSGCQQFYTEYGRFIVSWAGAVQTNSGVGSHHERGENIYPTGAMVYCISGAGAVGYSCYIQFIGRCTS